MEQQVATLCTKRLRLEMMTVDDAPGIYAYARDPEISRYVVWDSHRGTEDTVSYIGSVLAGYERGDMCDWVVKRADNGGIIGTCGFVEWNTAHARAELGYVIARAEWNRGYATEAARAVMEHGFGVMGLARIEAQCMPGNDASARVMEKLGMRFEGLLRDRIRAHGAQHDVRLYAIVRGDFRA